MSREVIGREEGDPAAGWPVGGGELGRLIRAHDWSRTRLGPLAGWPGSLRTATDLVLRSPVPLVLLWGPDGVMIYNDAYAAVAGGRHPGLLGAPVREGWPEAAAFNDHVMRVGLSGGTLAYRDQELTLHRHGVPEQVWMDLDYSPVLDETGRPAGVVAVVAETTARVGAERARVRAEAALIAERDRLASVLDGMAEAFTLLDRDFRILDVNAEALRLDGRPREALVGRPHWEAYPGTEESELGRLYKRAMTERRPASLEHRYAWPDGRVAWFDLRAYPTADGLALFYRDVTGRRESEEALRAAGAAAAARAAERAAILGQLAEGVIVTDREGRIVFVNQAAERLHGVGTLGVAPDAYAEAYQLLTEAGAPHPPEALPLARAVLRGETVTDARWRIRRPDGSEVLAVGSARPIAGPDGAALGAVLTVRDDTERARAEERLREETRVLETLNRTGAALSGELDLERVVQMVTDAGVEVTGARFGAYFHNEMDETGERLHLYTLSGAERADFERMGRPRATAIFGPTFRNEEVIRSDDILADPRYGRSEPHRGMPKGHLPVRSYLAVPVASRSGEVLGGLLFGHPEPGRFTERHERLITGIAAQAAVAIDNARLFQTIQRLNETLEARVEARTAELRQAEEQLRQAQKMEAVGQLTGGIAHDFNNLLTGIVGSLEILQRRVEAGRFDGLGRYTGVATTSAQRAAALTQRLLAFARRQPLDPKPIDANRLVASMEDLLRRTLGPQIELEMVLSGGLWPTLCDPNQLESAILNLAINARDVMPDGGRLTVETANAHLDEAYCRARAGEVAPGQYVSVSVTDTGTGMTPEIMAKAFEPFFTTKPIGQGTGLGLSMLYGFVRQSEGHVAVYSEPGQGTTFRLYLPRHRGRLDEAEAADGPGEAPRAEAGETVLVVEDEAAVRLLITETLEELGYASIEAVDGPSGLRLLQSRRRVDLLVTDVGLPGLNGRQLADAARETRPDLKVLFITGFAGNAAVGNGVLEPGMEMMTKPFALDQFAAKVRAMIEGR